MTLDPLAASPQVDNERAERILDAARDLLLALTEARPRSASR